MDLNRDELRRELKAIDAENKAIMPKWYDALRQIIGGRNTMSIAEKAALLGVPAPGRRQLFKFGGAAIMGAAVLAACGGDDDVGGTTTAGDGGTTTTAAVDGGMDLALARTAASLEKLAVDTYEVAIGSGLVTTMAIAEAATLFQAHHQAHLEALNGAINDLGGEEVTEMNEAVYDALVKPAVDAAAAEADIVTLALDLENAAAQTYVFAAGTDGLSTPALRSTIMTIGGIEARHAVVLKMAAQGAAPADVFPQGFFPSTNPLADIEGAVLTA